MHFSTHPQAINAVKLYKMLLKEARNFPQYNIREYAIRKIKRSFSEGRNCSPEDAQRLFREGTNSLELLKRQSVIYSQYYSPRSAQ